MGAVEKARVKEEREVSEDCRLGAVGRRDFLRWFASLLFTSLACAPLVVRGLFAGEPSHEPAKKKGCIIPREGSHYKNLAG